MKRWNLHEYVLLSVFHRTQPRNVLWDLVFVFMSRCYRAYQLYPEWLTAIHLLPLGFLLTMAIGQGLCG